MCFDKFCRENHLQYWLDGGTLLGAIRHKGFIPWDDDIDVCMPAADYVRCLKLCETGKLPPRLIFEKRKHKNCMKMIKILDKNESGACIDIFASFPIIKSIWVTYYYAIGSFCNSDRSGRRHRLISNILKYFAKKIVREERKGFKFMEMNAATYIVHVSKMIWKRENVFPLSEREFEGEMLPVPANFHEYLGNLYGNYMQLPPESERYPLHLIELSYAPPVIRNRTRIYTSGIFDLFHVGHLKAIQAGIALQVDFPEDVYLIVGVGSDKSASEYKRQPIIPFEQRMELVASIKGVDEVIEAPNYPDKEFYKNLRIHLHYQGAENDENDFYETAKSLGIMRFIGRQEVASTTDIIDRVIEREKETEANGL